MERYVYLAGTLGLTVYGQLIIKARSLAHATGVASSHKIDYLIAMFTDIGVLSGLAAAVGASVLWTLAIEKMAVGLAYPFMALSFVLVPLASMFLFREPLSLAQGLGLILIVAGVTINALAH